MSRQLHCLLWAHQRDDREHSELWAAFLSSSSGNHAARSPSSYVPISSWRSSACRRSGRGKDDIVRVNVDFQRNVWRRQLTCSPRAITGMHERHCVRNLLSHMENYGNLRITALMSRLARHVPCGCLREHGWPVCKTLMISHIWDERIG